MICGVAVWVKNDISYNINIHKHEYKPSSDKLGIAFTWPSRHPSLTEPRTAAGRHSTGIRIFLKLGSCYAKRQSGEASYLEMETTRLSTSFWCEKRKLPQPKSAAKNVFLRVFIDFKDFDVGVGRIVDASICFPTHQFSMTLAAWRASSVSASALGFEWCHIQRLSVRHPFSRLPRNPTQCWDMLRAWWKLWMIVMVAECFGWFSHVLNISQPSLTMSYPCFLHIGAWSWTPSNLVELDVENLARARKDFEDLWGVTGSPPFSLSHLHDVESCRGVSA